MQVTIMDKMFYNKVVTVLCTLYRSALSPLESSNFYFAGSITIIGTFPYRDLNTTLSLVFTCAKATGLAGSGASSGRLGAGS